MGVLDPAVTVVTVDRMLSAGVSSAWGCESFDSVKQDIQRDGALTGPAGNLDRVDIILLSTTGTRLCERVYVGSQDLRMTSKYMVKGMV